MTVATTQPVDGKFVVTVDGVAERPSTKSSRRRQPSRLCTTLAGEILEQTVTRRGPVALSADGRRHAYAGVRGNDVIVMLDGKELFRAPFSQAAPPVSLLQFTPDGKHLLLLQPDHRHDAVLPVDGGRQTGDPTVRRHAAAGVQRRRFPVAAQRRARRNSRRTRMLIVDGKDAGYTGQRARFSPDGRHVVCVSGGPSASRSCSSTGSRSSPRRSSSAFGSARLTILP